MMLAFALFLFQAPQPAVVPAADMHSAAATVVVASAANTSASLPAKAAASETVPAADAVIPDAPSDSLPSSSSRSIDAALINAPTVVSPALIMNVTPVTKKKSLAEERPTALKIWKGLTIAQHGAATFDAWTTRRNIETGRFRETNAWLEPFAGNNSLYAAMQVRPVLFDYLGRRMMRSEKKWVRNLWWVPQTAQTVTNLWCGAKNMSIH